MADFDVRYDRRVSEEFLTHFLPDGVATNLVDLVRYARYPVDLQLRKDPKSGAQHATLYVGLTSVLKVAGDKRGRLKLDVHPTHAKNGRFDAGWKTWRTPEELAAIWGEVELYLDRVIPIAAEKHASAEGNVQSAIATYGGTGRRFTVLDREVMPAYRDEVLKKELLAECGAPILAALKQASFDFGAAPDKFGTECDILGLDPAGRVMAVEVKPYAGGSIAWVAAQAAMYARIFKQWLDQDQDAATILSGAWKQRVALGLTDSASAAPAADGSVVPVVALQRGASAEMIRRMLTVRDVLAAADLGTDPIEVYEVNAAGALIPLDESRKPDGRPRATAAYAAAMNGRMIAWKRASAAVSDEARKPGSVRNRRGESVDVDYALPAEHAALNLLPEVRDSGIGLFKKLGIPWHQGSGGSPSPHLRSSQVQCVNALGQMIEDPERIKRAFSSALVDLAEVRDFGQIDATEAGRFLTFEFIGAADYFGEGRGGARTRGSQCTSVDAAFAYRTDSGRNALALIEWKFTESYPSEVKGGDKRLAERLRRYESDLLDPSGPIATEDVELSDLFHEPIYQLTRQQLLAHRLAADPEVDVDVVRVVHVLSPDNVAYQRSYVAPALRSRGATVDDIWQSLLRRPSDFVKVDPVVFLDPLVTSDEYVSRYGGGEGA